MPPQGSELLRALLDVLEAREEAVEEISGVGGHDEDVRVRDTAAARHQPEELGMEDLGQAAAHAVRQREEICGLPPGQLVPEPDVPLRQDERVPIRPRMDV